MSNLLDVNAGNISEYVTYLNNNFVSKSLYFKFFYNMKNGTSPVFLDNISDFVDGYAYFANATAIGSDIIEISFNNSYGMDQLCQECANAEKTGKINRPTNISQISDSPDITSIMSIIVGVVSAYKPPESGSCTQIDPTHSYIRLPVFKKKLGGGIRVKTIVDVRGK